MTKTTYKSARAALKVAREKARDAKAMGSIYDDVLELENGREIVISHRPASDGTRLFGAWVWNYLDEEFQGGCHTSYRRRELKL